MAGRNATKPIDVRSYVIILFLLAITFLVTGSVIIQSMKDYYYQVMMDESHRLATSYASSMETSIQASTIVDSLLNDKIRQASRAVMLSEQNDNNNELAYLARILDVDVIYAYSPSGIIQYSSNNQYIGWSAKEPHPVHAFMTSGKVSAVEEIRADTESGEYFKYGYARADDGCFYQIGVEAEKIQSFMNAFDVQLLIEQMNAEPYIDYACFYDQDIQPIAACADQAKMTVMPQEARTALLDGQPFSTTTAINGETAYIVMLPIFAEDESIGALALGHNTQNTDVLIRNISWVGVIGLSLIFAFLALLLGMTYNRNRLLVHRAYYNTLTDLPNRAFFDEFIKVRHHGARGAAQAILLINCRNFKTINKMYGYQFGDIVILSITEALKPLQDDDHRLFYLTADQFAFCVSDFNSQQELSEFAEKIIQVIDLPVQSQKVNMVIGVYEIPEEENDADEIIKNTAMAIDQLDESGVEQCRFFNVGMKERLARMERIEDGLRKAVDEPDSGHFHLVFQPILDLRKNEVYGFEALSRMNIDTMGAVPPDEFIAIAENEQLIVPLGRRILRTACLFQRTLQDAGYPDIMVTVNISAIQLLRDDFIEELFRVFEETGCEVTSMGLEITESIFSNDYDMINNRLQILGEQGIRIAIDDFGTGYSTLAREKELNVSALKIDKLFVDDIISKHPDNVLVGDIISMAHRLGHGVVAEGVEHEEQMTYLIEHDCDFLQGYLFSRPLPAKDALTFLES